MPTSLLLGALLMGLAGSPHCAAMCGAACGGLTRAGGGTGSKPIVGPGPGGAPGAHGAQARMAWFQAGRLAGYTAAGALAAGMVESLAWFSAQAAALRPVWTLFHLAVLAWGLTLLVLARQPAWAQQAALTVWGRVQPLVGGPGGVFGAGGLWIFMPCGLLWSALLVASLAGGPLQGALAMAVFAAASSLGLVLGPQLLARMRSAGNRLRQDWGTRAAGGLLAAAALFALWMDVAARVREWCA